MSAATSATTKLDLAKFSLKQLEELRDSASAELDKQRGLKVTLGGHGSHLLPRELAGICLAYLQNDPIASKGLLFSFQFLIRESLQNTVAYQQAHEEVRRKTLSEALAPVSFARYAWTIIRRPHPFALHFLQEVLFSSMRRGDVRALQYCLSPIPDETRGISESDARRIKHLLLDDRGVVLNRAFNSLSKAPEEARFEMLEAFAANSEQWNLVTDESFAALFIESLHSRQFIDRFLSTDRYRQKLTSCEVWENRDNIVVKTALVFSFHLRQERAEKTRQIQLATPFQLFCRSIARDRFALEQPSAGSGGREAQTTATAASENRVLIPKRDDRTKSEEPAKNKKKRTKIVERRVISLPKDSVVYPLLYQLDPNNIDAVFNRVCTIYSIDSLFAFLIRRFKIDDRIVFCEAARYGKKTILQSFLNNQDFMKKIRQENGEIDEVGTAFDQAVYYGQMGCVEELIQQKDITPFHIGEGLNEAAKLGHLNIVQFFVKHEKFKGVTSEALGSASVSAAEGGHPGIVLELMQQETFNTVKAHHLSQIMDFSAKNGLTEVVHALISRNKHSNLGEALVSASGFGYIGIVKAFIACDRFWEISVGQLGLAAEKAALNGHFSIVRTFLACNRFDQIPVANLQTIDRLERTKEHQDIVDALKARLKAAASAGDNKSSKS